MKLAHWISLSGLPDAEVAKRIGVTRQSLFRYKANARVPRPEILSRIYSLTAGAVTANDFAMIPAELDHPPRARTRASARTNEVAA